MNSNSNKQPQLMNGGEDEDPYKKAEGHIELRIENLTGFAQEPFGSRRLSAPVFVRGMPWKILVMRRAHRQTAENGRRPKCLGYFLQCNGADPLWSYSVTAQLKILAQKKEEEVENADHVRELNSQTFTAKQSEWGYPEFMNFDDLMNPDRGLYDAQSDSITLAADLTVEYITDKRFCDYMLVAQNELTLEKIPMSFSMQIGNLQWQVDYDYEDQNNKEDKLLELSCKDLAKARGVDNKVLLELIGYHRAKPKSELLYSSISDEKPVHRHLFTSKDNLLMVDIPEGRAFNNLLFTVRVLKERSQFPDFTKKPTVVIGRNTTNVTLRVGDQQFHVNKQLLSAHSLFFDRMFHGDYTAATQQEVELSLITHSAELFHHFLLVMCVNEVLPNSMNVSALFKLADFYDSENVREKCDQHLRMAREMPIEKRVLLARDHGSDETQAQIMDSANFEQLKAVNLLLMKNRSI